MAAGKKSKKEKKAARKAEKKARKAAKKAAREAARAAKTTTVAARPATKAVPKSAPAPSKKSLKVAARKRVAPSKKTAKKKAVKRAAPRRRVPTDRQKPESLRLRSAGPSFTVNDIEKSFAFYRDVLGFTLKERWEQDGALRGVELRAGSVTFWLGQDDWQKGRDRVKGQGFRIYCGTSQDVDAIARRVRDAGVTLLEEPKDQPWGGRDFAVVDPDGFTITISSGL